MSFVAPALLLLLALAKPVSPPMPDRIISHPGLDKPIWVSSSLALTADGKPNPAQFDAGGVVALEFLLEQPEVDGCVDAGMSVRDNYPGEHDRSSFDSSIDTADFILEAQIDGMAPGFMHGVPGHLYRVKPIAALKAKTQRGYYFLFLPVGTVPLGYKRICKSDPHFPSAPTIGQRLIVLSSSPIGLSKEFIDVEEPEDVILEEKSGTLTLAREFKEKSGTTLSSLPQATQYIKNRLAGAAGGVK